MSSDFWASKLGTPPQQRQMPAPAIPQPEPEADEPDTDQATWNAMNARRIETGSELFSISGVNHTWETNSHRVSDEGVFGRAGRKAQAALQQAIKSGKFNEAGRGPGALGENGDPRGTAAAVAELAKDGQFDTPRGSLG